MTEQIAVTSNRQSMKVSSFTIEKEELKKICQKLQLAADSAAKFEIDNYKQNDTSDEQHQINLQTIKDGFKIKVMISGKKGEQVWGDIDTVFDSVNFPDDLSTFLVDSRTTLKSVHNFNPRNYFVIFLNFAKPKVFDFSVMPTYATPNDSNIEVFGYDTTWVNGVFSELKSAVEQRATNFSIVHSHSIYDFFLWLIGFPMAFWMCFKLSFFINKLPSDTSAFVINAIYFYIFLCFTMFFRTMFHYLRWVCPLVEYKAKGNNINAHRAFITLIAGGVFTSFIYDIIKIIF